MFAISTNPRKVVYDQLGKPSRLSRPVSLHLSFFSLMSDPNLSRITATSLDPVTNTLAGLNMYLRTLIKTCTSMHSIRIHTPEAVTPMLHRHGPVIPPLAQTTPQTGAGMTYTQVSRPRDPGLGAS